MTADRAPIPDAAEAPRSPGVGAAGVAWRRVGLYTALAYAGVTAVALVLWAVGGSMRQPVLGTAFGALAMLMPLASGLLTERIAGRQTLLGREWAALRARPGRTIGRVIGFSAIAFVAITAAQLGAAWAGAAVPGAGRLASDAELAASLSGLAGTSVPTIPVPALVGAVLVQAFVAGLTINGVFAFGEEYGWRGVLAEELRPLGVVRANLLTGVIWGLWHAPLIALGHNYGDQWAIGIPLFVLITTPLSFVLWWARARAGSVAAAAVVHGAFNGFAGTFSLILVGADPVIAVPVGVLGGVALALVAAALWGPPGLRPAATGTRTTPA